MRTFVIIFAALCAMASAQYGDHSVNVAEQPGDQAYNNLVPNPDSSFYQPHNGNNNNNPNIVPDQLYYQPHTGNGGNGGYVQPSVGPAFVDNSGRPPYPYKQYQNPNARSGK